jgi:hypothetical protein
MAVKNMQSVATCTAEMIGVSATGTERTSSKRMYGERQAHFLSLPWRPQPGLMPMDLDAVAAQAVHHAAQSASCGPRARLARSASRTVLSTRPSFMRNYSGLPKRITNMVRG